MEIDAYAFIDPTGLVPVVNEVEWLPARSALSVFIQEHFR
jgi:hypothetical protein